MPNGAQTPTEEGEGSGGESQEEWDFDAADDDDGDDSDEEEEEEEEEEVAPPRSERRSKLAHDPAAERGKGSQSSRSRPSALGLLLRCRLRKLRSNLECRRSRRRSCRR